MAKPPITEEREVLSRTIHVRVSEDLYRKISGFADVCGMDLSVLTRALYREALEPEKKGEGE